VLTGPLYKERGVPSPPPSKKTASHHTSHALELTREGWDKADGHSVLSHPFFSPSLFQEAIATSFLWDQIQESESLHSVRR
jgi:hypothetical protein